ncbi:integrase core domain-containing protein, partial [Kocuria marina]|uniref:integrase core domain-containing protein n=1 Tax=Kocuria marina TaxID=223184 RepID=UPI0021A5889E
HGRGSQQALASKRAHKQRVGYTYLHSAVDGFSRLAYTEALDDEKAATTIGFFCRARVFFTAHGITRIHRVVTDNGANYTARDFTRAVEALASRHQRIRPYTPRHNGKVERYNRLLADEVLYARSYPSEQARREAIGVWVNHFNYHRPHTACGDQPPASRTPTRVNNVTPSYI